MLLTSTTEATIDENALNQFLSYFKNGNYLGAVLTFVIGYILYRVLYSLTKKLIRRTHLDGLVRSFLLSSIRIVLLLMLLLAVAQQLGIPISSVLVVFSTLGLAISLSMQNYLSNLAGGIVILLTKPFQLDDIIEVEGVTGKILKIDLYYTKVNTYENKSVYVPNGQMANAVVVNGTREDRRRADFVLKIPDDMDLQATRERLLDIITANPLCRKDPAPSVPVTGIGYRSVLVTVYAWADADDWWTLKCQLLENIALEYKGTGLRTIDQ